MNFLTILTFIGFICFAAYNVLLNWLNGWQIPESVSATSYILQDKSKTGRPDGFTYICLITAMTFLPLWITVSPDKWMFLPFLCCAGVVFAGSTPMFRESFQSTIHYTSGIISAITYILWFIFFGGWYWLLVVIGLIVSSMILKKSWKEYVYWIEVYGVLILTIKLLFFA